MRRMIELPSVGVGTLKGSTKGLDEWPFSIWAAGSMPTRDLLCSKGLSCKGYTRAFQTMCARHELSDSAGGCSDSDSDAGEAHRKRARDDTNEGIRDGEGSEAEAEELDFDKDRDDDEYEGPSQPDVLLKVRILV